MNYLTFDTETMDVDEKLIYDLGFAVHDVSGNVLHQDNFLIQEVFDNSEIMDKAFYKKNYPLYLEMLKEGTTKKIPMSKGIQLLQNAAATYEVTTLCAYNLFFDMQSWYDTVKFVNFGIRKPRDEEGKVIRNNSSNSTSFFDFCKTFINREIFNKELKYLDIYGMTCKKLLTQDDYINLAIKNEWFTEKGNIKTNAECAYRYITNSIDFDEAHTALADVLIEIEIFKKCFETPGEYTDEIIYTPFRLVKKRREELYGKPA